MPVQDQNLAYQDLTPDKIIDAVESQGHYCSASILPLNSYENRVYQVGIEESVPIIAKFYRPQRWSNEAILEEHHFSFELAEQEIPIVPPMQDDRGNSLHHFSNFRFALYRRQGGRWPDLDDLDKLEWMGRLIGRIHAVGTQSRFKHRPKLDIESFGYHSVNFLKAQSFIPTELLAAYEAITELVLAKIETIYKNLGELNSIRLHGDCHPGNILWTDDGPHFVDLDDCRSGPAIQDLWMLLSGDRGQMNSQIGAILDGYQDFCEFDTRELALIEALRSLRMIHYSGWLAKRWSDPAFKINFPWFNSQRYWEEQILGLKEQAALLDEPPLIY